MLNVRKAAWRAGWRGVAASLVLTVSGCQTAPEKQTASPCPYRHLVFIRNGGAQPDTLLLGTLGAEGLTHRELHKQFNLGLEFVGAFQGRFYALRLSDLLSIDLRTGDVTGVATGIESHDYASGRLFWLDAEGAIHEYDLRTGRARCVTAGPIRQACFVQLAASPDGERLALFVPTTERLGELLQLTVVRVADGRTARVGEPADYHDPRALLRSTFSVRLPFLWLDSQHVAFLRTERGAAIPGLMHANVVTGEVTEVARLTALPEKSFVELEHLPAPTFVARTFDWRQRHVIDPGNGKLTEGQSIGGAFRVEETWEGDDTIWQLYYGEKLLSDRIGSFPPAVSPDGKQVAWSERGRGRRLCHFDADTGRTRALVQGWFADSFLWLTDRDVA